MINGQWAAILLRRSGFGSWVFGALLKGLTSVLKVEESAGYSLQNQNGLIIETVWVLGGLKKGVNFYYCRVCFFVILSYRRYLLWMRNKHFYDRPKFRRQCVNVIDTTCEYFELCAQ